jgi:hypothetical protein
MRDEDHSESEFYYPEVENEGCETGFYQFNEVQSNDRRKQRNSQEEIDCFIRAEKLKHSEENSKRHECIQSLSC